MVLSENTEIADGIRAALGRDGSSVDGFAGSIVGVNGKVHDYLASHDLMIFEADPDDDTTLSAIEALVARRGADKALIALTDDDITIAKARRLQALGVDDVLPRGMDPDALGRSIRETLQIRAARNQQAQAEASQGKVLSFVQARGGIGATTLAVNLAQALASGRSRRAAKCKVVLVDLDLQFGNANVYLDLEDNGGILKLINSGAAADAELLASVIQHHPSGIDLISSPVPLAPLTAVQHDTIAALLDHLIARYDYVLVDLPRVMVDWIEPVIARTTRLVLVTDTTVPCIRQAQRLLDFYREANIGLVVETVVNREARPLLKSQHIREAETALNTKLTNWIPDNSKIARKAADFGVPLVSQYPRSDLAKAVRRLAEKIVASTAVAARATD